MAVDANSDPRACIRVAVVVADQSVADGIGGGGVAETELASAMKIFTDINEAETGLARPLIRYHDVVTGGCLATPARAV